MGPCALRPGRRPRGGLDSRRIRSRSPACRDLGSVINTAVSVFGDEALILGLDEPELLRAFYRNVTDLMLLCLRYFPAVDGRKLFTVFVGDCTVAMISPAQYAAFNQEPDSRLAEFAASMAPASWSTRIRVPRRTCAPTPVWAPCMPSISDRIPIGRRRRASFPTRTRRRKGPGVSRGLQEGGRRGPLRRRARDGLLLDGPDGVVAAVCKVHDP